MLQREVDDINAITPSITFRLDDIDRCLKRKLDVDTLADFEWNLDRKMTSTRQLIQGILDCIADTFNAQALAIGQVSAEYTQYMFLLSPLVPCTLDVP